MEQGSESPFCKLESLRDYNIKTVIPIENTVDKITKKFKGIVRSISDMTFWKITR